MESPESPYNPPETDPKIRPSYSESLKLTKPPKCWSNRKLCIVTFLPLFLCLVCRLMMMIGIDCLEFFSYFILIVVLVCFVTTVIQFHKSKGYGIVSQVVLWGLVHMMLYTVGLVGCLIVMNKGGH